MKITLLVVLLTFLDSQNSSAENIRAGINSVENLKLNKLVKCHYTGIHKSLIGDRFVSGENQRWIQSKSITRLIRSMDTVSTTPYHFNLRSDVYITPEGFQAFISVDPIHSPDTLDVTFYSFEEIGFVKGTFDLMANESPVSIQGAEVRIGKDLICNNPE